MAVYKGNKLLAANVAGKSAYEYALAGGYQGTEEEFNIFMSNATVNYVQPDEPMDAQPNAFWLDTDEDFQVDIDVDSVIGEHNSDEDAHEDIRQAIKDMNVSVSSAEYKIGDTLTTARTDLGDEWLLCNGEYVEREQYEELGKLFTASVTKNISGLLESPNKIEYHDGIWIALGKAGVSNNNATISISRDPFNEWTTKTLAVNCVLYDIAYHDGIWVAVGCHSASSRYYPYIFITTDPFGDWTAQRLNEETPSEAIYLYGVTYYNGIWMAVGKPNIYTTTDPFGQWTIHSTIAGYDFNVVECYDGTWVIAGAKSGNLYIFATTDLSLEWNQVKTSESTCSLNSLVYDGHGTWMALGGTTSGSKIYTYTTTDLFGDWVEKTVSSSSLRDSALIYYKGHWVITACHYSSGTQVYTPYIYTTTDPLGEWEHYELSNWQYNAIGIAVDNNDKFILFSKVGIYTNLYFTLPTITNDLTYTYIKAKEASDL